MAVLTPRSVFRRYDVDGVPSSGHHKVIKDEVVQLLEQIFGVSRGGWVVTQTLAELNGVTPENETDGGVVLADPDPANNGYYQRDGGVWVRGRGFPDTFARVALSGNGSAQTGVVDAGVNPADAEVFFAFVETENEGPLTLAIGGEAPREVVNLAGNPLSAGEWTGAVMFALRDGKYQLLLDAGAAASAAQSASEADASADRAETEADRAATNAMSVVDRAWFKTVADLLADNNSVIGYATSGADFEVAAGDIIEAQGFRYEVAASDATDAHVDTAGGVKLYVLPSADGRVSLLQFGQPSGTDDTAIFQKMMDNFLRVRVPNVGQTWWLDVKALGTGSGVDNRYRPFDVRSGHDILLEHGCEIECIGNDANGYSIFHLNRVSNVVIDGVGATIRGDRDTHIGTEGQGGHGIALYSCSDVAIRVSKIEKCWGDGIYVGDYDSGTPVPNQNIRIEDVDCDNNRRQGLSIITVDGLTAVRSKFRNTNGALPECGVDIEPNQMTQINRNILFFDCEFNDNNGRGLLVSKAYRRGGSGIRVVQSEMARNGQAGIRIETGLDPDGPEEFNEFVEINSCHIHNNVNDGIDLGGDGTRDTVIVDCDVHHNRTNLWARVDTARTSVRGGRYYNSRVGYPGIRMDGFDHVLDGCFIASNGSNAQRTESNVMLNGPRMTVRNCTIRRGAQNSHSGIYLTANASDARLIGNDLFQSGAITGINTNDDPSGLIAHAYIDNGGAWED